MSDDQLYIKNDLEDYASNDIPSVEWGSPHRSELLESAVDPDSMEFYSTGGYQGKMVFALDAGGYIWLVKEAFGSCSVCDGLLAADDDWEYTKKMLRNAYCFESKKDAIDFLDTKLETEGWYWNDVAREGKDCVEKL